MTSGEDGGFGATVAAGSTPGSRTTRADRKAGGEVEVRAVVAARGESLAKGPVPRDCLTFLEPLAFEDEPAISCAEAPAGG